MSVVTRDATSVLRDGPPASIAFTRIRSIPILAFQSNILPAPISNELEHAALGI